MKKNKMISNILIFSIILTIIMSIIPTNTYAGNAKQTISSDINKIDDSKYRGIRYLIKELKKEHPNWNFKVLYTGLDWDDVIDGEDKHGRNLIGANQSRYSGEWICQTCGNKRYSGGNSVCISPVAIEYMMDPRNSISYESVFQFLELSYDQKAKYSADTIKKILKDSFMDDGKLDKYIKIIMDECKDKDVNPYYIAIKIILEQGTKGGITVKMYDEDEDEYYYNIFNINAAGTTKSDILRNALKWAKNKGWTSMEKCIEAGVEFIAKGYISAGQNTLYFERFDVIGDSLYWHQYAQNVLYAETQGTLLKRVLEKVDAVDDAYTFVIPLYENMPTEICRRPNSERSSIYIGTVDDDNDNTDQHDNDEKEYAKGDVTGDTKIDSADLLYLRKYLLGKIKLTDEQKKSADTNKDGTIDSADLLNLRKYLLGKIKNF